jgi:hypothetical protein
MFGDWSWVHTAATVYFSIGVFISLVGGHNLDKKGEAFGAKAVIWVIFTWPFIMLGIWLQKRT